MTAALRWIWTELNRPRGRTRHRFYRVGRSSRSGVALLFTLTALMLMTILVTEITHDATVRIQLAAHHRDESKAELLARSGVNFYRLILVGSKQFGNNPMIGMAGSYLGINADTLWQLLPFIDTSMLRMVFASGQDLAPEEAAEGVTDEVREASREGGEFDRNFLDFDGDFSAGCTDINKKIYAGNLLRSAEDFGAMIEQPDAMKLYGLMQSEEDQTFLRENNLEGMELIGNLADWTDPDNNRLYGGGLEDGLYQNLESPYMPKNAPFDTPDEIRLVDGWHRDDVWERYGQHLTIFGSGKVNINTADKRVIKALLWAYLETPATDLLVEEMATQIVALRRTPPMYGGGLFTNAQHFESVVNTLFGYSMKPEFAQAVNTQSEVFKVVSKGTVRNATVTIEAVFDFSKSATGKIVYWRIQ